MMKLGLQNETTQALFRRKWFISTLLLGALVVNTLLVLAKKQLLWAVRSSYIPPYTPPRALPFSNVKKFESFKGIPKIIHHSWKDDNVPKIFNTWQQRWKELHPTWEHHLWTDDDNRELIKKHFPFFLTTYDAFPLGVMRADSVRYMYMYLYGGLYTDLDMDPLKSTEELISRLDLPADKPAAILGYMGDDYKFEHNIPNAWMLSTPQHPFWMFCILKIIQLNTQGYNNAEALTGPAMLFRALQEYNEAQRRISGVVAPGVEDGTSKLFDVHLLKPGLIYPIDWHQRSDRANEFCEGWFISDDVDNKCRKAFPDSYTITYWTHSWE